jgi:hypothetical protein
VPSMFMADFNAPSRQVNAMSLREVQRRILQDKEFLLSLESAETRETSRTKCAKRRASLDLLTNSHMVNGGDGSRRISSTDEHRDRSDRLIQGSSNVTFLPSSAN